MDEPTFNSEIFHAVVMRDIEDPPDYWASYYPGLQRTFYGE
jgi:hypothetical protein